MSKWLKRILRLFGVKQFMIFIQTDHKRTVESFVSAPQYIAWIATFTVELARANDITPLATITEIKKAMQMLERKEEQYAEESAQTDLSDSAIDHRHSDISKH